MFVYYLDELHHLKVLRIAIRSFPSHVSHFQRFRIYPDVLAALQTYFNHPCATRIYNICQ
jgi:hypothetical protein